MTDPSPEGTWIAVDVGSVRVGVARSDPRAVLAVPVATLSRDSRGGRDLAELAALVADYAAIGVVVGLPRTLAGREGTAAEQAREYAARLQAAIAPVPVHLVDERLTTVSAQRKLHQRGIAERAGRAVIDQAAAVEMLQQWLDTRRSMSPRTPPVRHDGERAPQPHDEGP